LSGNEPELLSGNKIELLSGNAVTVLSHNHIVLQLRDCGNGNGDHASHTNSADRTNRRRARFQALDRDGDRRLSRAEFHARANGQSAVNARQRFQRRDADRDGVVSLSELVAEHMTPPRARHSATAL
jgi:hypothetical protein